MIRLTDEEREVVRAYQCGRAASRTVARVVSGVQAPVWRTSFAVLPRPLEEGSLDLVLAAARHPGEETGVARWTVGAPVWHMESRLDYRYGIVSWTCDWKRSADRVAGGVELDVRRVRGETAPTWPWAPILHAAACVGSPWEWIVRAAANPDKVAPKFAPTVLAAWPKHPGVELLARAGLAEGWFRPTALGLLERSPRLRSWVAQNAEALAREAVSPTVALPIAGRGGTMEEVRREAYYRAMWHGCPLHGVDRMEAAAWCDRHDVTCAEYATYLDLAALSGLDPRSRSVAFPRGAESVHALLECEGRIRAHADEKARRVERAEEERRLVSAAERARKALARLALPAAWSIRVPESQGELAREGQRMRNCIGSGVYARNMADGFCVCLVIAGPDDVRADVEIAAGRVRQCYGPCNSPPHAVAREIATRAARALRRAAA